MSSLQQALENAASRLKTKKQNDNNNDEKRHEGCGTFETSFAQGLDISELVAISTVSISKADGQSTDTSPFKRESAAENLLKIKKEERRKQQIQEAEEIRMEEALQRRLNSFKHHTCNRSKERKQSFDVGDALFRMHDTDETASSIISKKARSRKVGSGGRANRRQHFAPKRNNHKTKSTRLAKKSRHTKF